MHFFAVGPEHAPSTEGTLWAIMRVCPGRGRPHKNEDMTGNSLFLHMFSLLCDQGGTSGLEWWWGGGEGRLGEDDSIKEVLPKME